jgi:GDP-D-mannose dehydratase
MGRYNLGAQSHVTVSFESPEYTCDVCGWEHLEAIRFLELEERLVSIKHRPRCFAA